MDLLEPVARRSRTRSISSPWNASQSGAPSAPPALRTRNTSTTLGRRSGPRRPRAGGRRGAPPPRGRRRRRQRRVGREHLALDDRQPVDGQERAEGREELERVVADDLDPPAARAFGPGLDRHGLLVAQREAPAEVPGHVVERRTPRSRPPGTRPGGAAPRARGSGRSARSRAGSGRASAGRDGQGTATSAAAPRRSRPAPGSGKLTAYGESGRRWSVPENALVQHTTGRGQAQRHEARTDRRRPCRPPGPGRRPPRPRLPRGRPDPLRRRPGRLRGPARCRRGPAPRPGDPLRPG